jgi:GNAT superfamily N-acetyltransferase
MQKYLQLAYQRNVLKEKCHTHLLIAKLKEKVIAGTIIDFIGCENNICFGVIWFIVVAKENRTRGVGTFVVNKSINILQRDALVLGYPYLYGVFDEVNNVAKMTEEQIKIDRANSMDPEERENFWEKRGFHIVDTDYSQPPPARGLKPVDYVSLRVHPLHSEWIKDKSIPSNVLVTILFNLFLYLGEGLNPKTDPTCQRILSSAKSRDIIRIIM